jgi:hypothetical protein
MQGYGQWAAAAARHGSRRRGSLHALAPWQPPTLNGRPDASGCGRPPPGRGRAGSGRALPASRPAAAAHLSAPPRPACPLRSRQRPSSRPSSSRPSSSRPSSSRPSSSRPSSSHRSSSHRSSLHRSSSHRSSSHRSSLHRRMPAAVWNASCVEAVDLGEEVGLAVCAVVAPGGAAAPRRGLAPALQPLPPGEVSVLVAQLACARRLLPQSCGSELLQTRRITRLDQLQFGSGTETLCRCSADSHSCCLHVGVTAVPRCPRSTRPRRRPPDSAPSGTCRDDGPEPGRRLPCCPAERAACSDVYAREDDDAVAQFVGA